MPQYAIALIVGLASALSTAHASRPPDVATPPEAESPADEAPAAEPPPPASPTLAPIDGTENGGAERLTADAIAALRERMTSVEGDSEKIQLALAAANRILSEGVEPACSLVILHLDPSPPTASLKEALDQAGELLTTAQATLDRSDAGEADADAWRPQATHRLETLRAFHAGLSAFLLPGDDARTARRAASRLSPLLEDPDKRVAAAATFWQACLRSLDSDTSRAMSVLDLALSPVRAHDLPYAFFARLMRCRLIARDGGHAAAIALLIQMEDRCHDWFLEETGRRDAVRTIHLTRSQLLRSWKARMADTDDEAAQQWIDERLRQIDTEVFREGENTVLRLRPVIPLIATAPTPAEADDDP